MSNEIFKREILYPKALGVLEVIAAPMTHMLHLSIVEIVIHGKLFYSIGSDFASILFMMSVAMIIQAIRKKNMPNVTKIPVKMSAVVND